MYSAYTLNKQGDNIQPWHTPFPIWSQSVVPCPVLTVASWPAYRFLRRQVRWSGIPISFRIFHSLLWSTTVKGFGVVNKTKVNVFLELSCFFYDPTDVGNLISGSSTFSKSSWNIWNFMVHMLLKIGLENFEHYFASVWDERNCAVVCTFLGIVFPWDWKEKWPFPVLWPLLSFPDSGREHSPTHQQKTGLKIYWTWTHPSNKTQFSPPISLLSLSIRGQTEWKSQSQKTNQTDHIEHNLV